MFKTNETYNNIIHIIFGTVAKTLVGMYINTKTYNFPTGLNHFTFFVIWCLNNLWVRTENSCALSIRGMSFFHIWPSLEKMQKETPPIALETRKKAIAR